MRKIFQNFYKKTIYLLFKIIYGKIIYSDANISDKKLLIEEAKDEKLLSPDKKKYLIFKIINGRICTDFVENVAVISKNKIIDKASYQQVNGELKSSKHNSVIYKGTPYFKKRIDGTVLSLTQGASGHKNYFHWLYDILPKIKICSSNYDLKKIDYLYLSNLEEYQKMTLKILGLENINILDANKNRHIIADQIITTEHPWYKRGFILEEAKKLPSWIVKWIATTFLNYAEEFKCNEKIFIDRSESSFGHCQIQNNQEIIEFLKNKGFTSYKVGQLPFLNQIFLFNNAKIIIGAHGAAFANLAFCKKNTKIVDIKPKNHPNLVDKRISEINELNFNFIETEEIPKNLRSNGDILLDTNLLDKLL